MFCCLRPFTVGRGSWLPQEPDFLCGVAPVPEGEGQTSDLRSSRACAPGSVRGGGARAFYATIFIKRLLTRRDSRATPPHRQNFHSVALFGKWTGSPNGRLYGSVRTLSSRQESARKAASAGRPQPQKKARRRQSPDCRGRKGRPPSTGPPLHLLLARGGARVYSASPPASSPSPAATTAFWVVGSGTEMMSDRSSKLCSIAA